MAPKRAAAKTAPSDKPAVQQVIDFNDAPEFNAGQLSATLIAFAASLLLILDVITGHMHTLIACTSAAGLLLLAAIINWIRSCCLFDLKKKLAAQAACYYFVCVINVLTLDGFLYEEETYNYFGHKDNELKRERTMGAVLELFIAALISYCIYREYRKPKEMSFKKAPRRSREMA